MIVLHIHFVYVYNTVNNSTNNDFASVLISICIFIIIDNIYLLKVHLLLM